MGTKAEPGTFDCYEAAEEDEPMFVLLARDPDAPAVVRQWTANRMQRLVFGADISNFNMAAFLASLDKLIEARACADQMEMWRAEHRD
jgi:hypothetical protein